MTREEFRQLKPGCVLSVFGGSKIIMLRERTPQENWLVKWSSVTGLSNFHIDGGIDDFSVESEPTEESLGWVKEVLEKFGK